MAPGIRWTSDLATDSDQRGRGRRPRLLLICDYRPYEATAVLDHIEALRTCSRYEVFVIPVFGDLPDELDLDAFDGLVIHYNVVMSNAAYLSPLARLRIRQFRGVKAAFVQDEYRFVNRTRSVMRTLGIGVLFTNVPQDQVEVMYPPEAVPELKRAITVLTGYVPEPLLRVDVRPYRDRVMDVAYRGRRLPPWLGRLAHDKSAIADRFAIDAPKFGLAVDISCQEEDRLYGQAWVEFLSHSKAMLGVESGANVIDFDGSIEDAVRESIAAQPDISFERLHRSHMAEVEGRIRLNQISPRCFEAAALGTLMVLYPGHYSGILQAWRHYVPLQKDHSNMDEVVHAIRDPATWERITRQARQEVALNQRNSFRAMVEAVDDGLNLTITARKQIHPDPFAQVASRNFARMPFTELRAFGLPPAINRIRLLGRRVARVLTPSPLAMSVSEAPPETREQRLRQRVAYMRALVYWMIRPWALPWNLVLAHRGALLRELTEVGRLQQFGARALASGAESPFTVLLSEGTGELRVVLRADVPATGSLRPGMPEDLSWASAITLSLHFTDPWLIPPGIGDGRTRPLGALSAVLRARPNVGRRLLAGGAPWCEVVLVDQVGQPDAKPAEGDATYSSPAIELVPETTGGRG